MNKNKTFFLSFFISIKQYLNTLEHKRDEKQLALILFPFATKNKGKLVVTGYNHSIHAFVCVFWFNRLALLTKTAKPFPLSFIIIILVVCSARSLATKL